MGIGETNVELSCTESVNYSRSSVTLASLGRFTKPRKRQPSVGALAGGVYEVY
jgi:hypothetical protein